MLSSNKLRVEASRVYGADGKKSSEELDGQNVKPGDMSRSPHYAIHEPAV